MTTRDPRLPLDRPDQAEVTRLRRTVANDDRPVARKTEKLSSHLWGEPEADDA